MPEESKLAIEVSSESSFAPCECCGQMTSRVWGFVYEHDAATAAYYVEWTPGHEGTSATFDLRFITQRLKLKVNESKSAVARPQERKFLGFSFTSGPEIKRAIAPKALTRFKDRIREITRQAKGVSIETTVKRLATYMVGWRGYFGFCETPEVLIGLIRWVRLRLRCALWRQWKTPRRRQAALLELGVRPRLAANTAGSGRGPWYLARSKALSVGASNAYFRSLGLPSLFENY